MDRQEAFKVIRIGGMLALLAFTILCRYSPLIGEFYARHIYPVVSALLSAFSSLFPFPLMEFVVIGMIAALLAVPVIVFRRNRKPSPWKKVVLREAELLVWIYVWFYIGWGNNYFRQSIYERMDKEPARFDEVKFKDFLGHYSDSLNFYCAVGNYVSPEEIKEAVHKFYASLPEDAGLAQPRKWQEPKEFVFTSLYSGVSVSGSMAPFTGESLLNADLCDLERPFTYAHEFSHLMGVSSEAEANYWAYRFCTESDSPALKYSGYYSLFPYVLGNASILGAEEYRAWVAGIRPEVLEQFRERQAFWESKESPVVNAVQTMLYDAFLKGNRISDGTRNYSQVISLILSLEDIESHS